MLHFGRIHDIIFYYSKTANATRNDVYLPNTEEYINSASRHIDENGRRYQLYNFIGPGGAAKVFADLLKYCKLDTLAMVEIFTELVGQ